MKFMYKLLNLFILLVSLMTLILRVNGHRPTQVSGFFVYLILAIGILSSLCSLFQIGPQVLLTKKEKS